MKKYVIILAGGKGLRMGTDIPKQFLLLREKPVLMHTIEVFYNYDPYIRIILVLSEEQKNYWKLLCEKYQFTVEHQITYGGETRFHSVKNGLQLIIDEDSLVAIHDGVRPLVTQKIISNAFETAEKGKSAYPVIPVPDTLRRLLPNKKNRLVDRSKFFLVQTPQVFSSKMIIRAYHTDYFPEFTDDVSVAEKRKSCKAIMIEGSRENIKITTPVDLAIAEAILKCRT
ncbi:MAG: 2-C-methyl-D-erythritol 4-phosphate cytidylyltransferase [Dysgonamonadaceae bacterium]|nr:2-C-methyl-D-erythritol 4-phosphate cytidylyltransferase [Dysgonamonadaceae bacterium]